MQLVPVLLDEDVSFAMEPGAGDSVLVLPLGTGSVLTRLLGELTEHGYRRAMVVSGRVATRCGKPGAAMGGKAFRVVSPAQLGSAISACETSDYLMIVRARYWPASGHDFGALARGSTRFRGASHAVAMAPSHPVAREQLVCETDGRVRCVHRLYDAMNWPEAASSMIVCSLVPAHVLAGESICDPASLRRALAARGVLTQDVPVMTEVYDLSEPAGILALSEQAIVSRSWKVPDAGYTLRSQRALVGRECRIHPSACLQGPIIIQHGAAVEEGARIVGPALLGEGARIGKGATVVGSVVGFGATVPAGAAVLQRVVLADGHHLGHGSTAVGERTFSDDSFAWQTPGRHPSIGQPSPRPGRWRAFLPAVKRIVDFAGAAVGLVLLSPLLILTALLIKLTSPGPVFFVHRREGKGGREFPCLKFRGMVANAHLMQRELYEQNEVDGPQFKLKLDPRETRLGRWLRRTNIDELPQLFNVLAGHMSLVGPRPSPFRENQICVSWRQARLSVRPGITGLWQLCRDRRSGDDFHQWIYYDLAYVRNISLVLDLKILLYTILTGAGRVRVPLSRLVRTERVIGNGSDSGAAEAAAR